MKRLVGLLVCLLLLSGAAMAQELDVTLTGKPADTLGRLHNAQRGKVWVSEDGELAIASDEPMYGLALCFAKPTSYQLILPDGTAIAGDTRFLHVFHALDGVSSLRVRVSEGGTLSLSQVRAFGLGDVPADVQRWQEAGDKVDLLILSAHPDDELIYMGGLLPYYTQVKPKRVLVCYMTGDNDRRREELLDGLWHCGITLYPDVGTLKDVSTRGLKEGYKAWNQYLVYQRVTGLLRRYRPDVCVTHAVKGEYGHGAHCVCADAMTYACENAGDAACYPSQAKELGVWQVKKLYLHLYSENKLTFDFRKTYEQLGGRSPVTIAREAFLLHESQQGLDFHVDDTGQYGCAKYGLRLTTVGLDAEHDDLFENIN